MRMLPCCRPTQRETPCERLATLSLPSPEGTQQPVARHVSAGKEKNGIPSSLPQAGAQPQTDLIKRAWYAQTSRVSAEY
jgi:hypothetical protein